MFNSRGLRPCSHFLLCVSLIICHVLSLSLSFLPCILKYKSTYQLFAVVCCVGLLLLGGGGGWSCVLDNVANGAISVE